MTSNIEQRGLDEGFESGVIVRGDDARQLKDIMQTWWEEFPLKLSVNSKIGEVEGQVQVWFGDRSLRVTIEKHAEINLGEIVAKPGDNSRATPPAPFRLPALPTETTLFHKVLYKWTTIQPESGPKIQKRK